MRNPLLPVAALALALVPGTVLGAVFTPEAPTQDLERIVFASRGAGPVLVVSAIEQEAGPGSVLFRPVPGGETLRDLAPPPPRVLESPEEILLSQRAQSDDPAGFRANAKLLDALLLLCSPLVIPLILRKRAAPLEWPEEEEDLEPASPM